MKKPYIEMLKEKNMEKIYKKLYCHSFSFIKDLNDKTVQNVYFGYVIGNNKKLGGIAYGGLEVNKSINDHFERIKKVYGDAYLDVVKFNEEYDNEEYDNIDIYFEAY